MTSAIVWIALLTGLETRAASTSLERRLDRPPVDLLGEGGEPSDDVALLEPDPDLALALQADFFGDWTIARG